MTLKPKNECECSDHGCPVHHGQGCSKAASILLFRIDMVDHTGTWFCVKCADDAMEAGVYRVGDPGERIRNRRGLKHELANIRRDEARRGHRR